MMKNLVCVLLLMACAGCDSLRFAPGESQKQNAWLHRRTTQLAAEQARAEATSETLQGLTDLSHLQSDAFVAYFGVPQEVPPVETAEQLLSEEVSSLARTASAQASQRPDLGDVWDSFDGYVELGLGIAGVFGGVCGLRIVRFLRTAREKSRALREIIIGCEKFKKMNDLTAKQFKAAQRGQTESTRRIVAEYKAAA